MGSSSRPCRTVGGTHEQREGRTDCRLEPQRALAASSSAQFSSLRPNSPRLVSVRFGSFRLVSLARPLPLVTGAMARPPDVPCRLTFCQSFSSAPSSSSSLTSQCAALAFRSWRNASRLLAVGVRFTVLQAPSSVPFYHHPNMLK